MCLYIEFLNKIDIISQSEYYNFSISDKNIKINVFLLQVKSFTNSCKTSLYFKQIQMDVKCLISLLCLHSATCILTEKLHCSMNFRSL